MIHHPDRCPNPVSLTPNPFLTRVVAAKLLSVDDAADVTARAHRCLPTSGSASVAVPTDILATLLDGLAAHLSRANRTGWGFEADGFDVDDPPEIVADAPESASTGPHMEWGLSSTRTRRKIGFQLLLSPGDSFVGGDVLFTDEHFVAPRSAGVLVAFPAYLPYVVYPVTEGRRLTIRGWLHGPSFT